MDKRGRCKGVRRAAIFIFLALLTGCSAGVAAPTTSLMPTEVVAAAPVADSTSSAPATTPPAPPTTAATTTSSSTTTTTVSPFARPDWLGTRVLPLGPDGENGIAQPTPPELRDRRLETIDLLTPPPGDEFVWTVGALPEDVIARSTWTEDCPVARDDLAYITVSHIGFDGRFHTGELIVNAAVADDIVGVFARLHAARFPIEQLRVTTREALDAPPTGDGNGSGAFGCRPATGKESWSEHAYGLAIDINPFHNPYVKGDLVLPELATAYLDRDRELPGMVFDGGVVVEAFADIGWAWGGNWKTLKDWMHFSRSGH